jgi:hypothetical protein
MARYVKMEALLELSRQEYRFSLNNHLVNYTSSICKTFSLDRQDE